MRVGARPARRGKPGGGPAPGWAPRGGHGGAHRDGARPRRTRARPRAAARCGLARHRAARYPDRRIRHRPLPCASRFSVSLQKSGFWGLFSPAPLKLVLVRQKSAVVAGGAFTSGGPSCTSRGPAVYPAGNDAGQRPDVPGRERLAAGAAGRGKRPAATAGRPCRDNAKTARPGRHRLPSRPRRPRATPRWARPPRWRRGRRPRPGRRGQPPGRGRRRRAGRCAACR